MLLLALLLVAAPAKKPPAHLSVPKSVREQRSYAPAEDEQLPIFSDPRLADALGDLVPRPGAWVEYAVLPKNGPQLRVRISVLAPLRPDGSYWLEAASQLSGGPPMAVKLLVRGQPTRVRDLQRAMFYMGGQSPLELPVSEAQEQGVPESKRPLPKIFKEKPRELTVAAGRFACELVRVEDTHIARSAQVPLWGLVRVDSKERRVELIGLGTEGAQTVFPPGWGDEPAAQGKGNEIVK